MLPSLIKRSRRVGVGVGVGNDPSEFGLVIFTRPEDSFCDGIDYEMCFGRVLLARFGPNWRLERANGGSVLKSTTDRPE